MEANFHHKDALRTQLREAYGRIVYTYTTHLKMVNRISKNGRVVKTIQIVLSAISTGGILGTIITNELVLAYIGGLFSTALLVLNLYIKDFNHAEDIKQHRVAADNLWYVREQYISLLTDFCILSEEQIIIKRDDLQNRTFELYQQSPKTDPKSYSAAKKALQSEEEQFFTPEEIDKMLPVHLRIT
jgi:predicted RNA-binding protein YlqC (UPF0109 family)